jgi:nucleoside-diphosphate-sugar epimerase
LGLFFISLFKFSDIYLGPTLSNLSNPFADEPDVVFHLATLPDGAAEQDPQLSKQVNLDATLALTAKA